MPISSMALATRSGGRSMRTPRCSSTSADPQRELIERLPCLATRTPAPATTKAAVVEMLKVQEASPPVPQVSINGLAAAGKFAEDNGRGVPAHGGGEAHQLVHHFALDAQRRQKRSNLHLTRPAGKDLLHCGFRFDAREVFAGNDFLEGFVDHRFG